MRRAIQLAVGACCGFLFASAAIATTHYVSLTSTNPVPPYTDWGTAATNIQDAIDSSVDGDVVTVNDGIYATGGRPVYGSLTNRVVINKAITVQSVNGPPKTTIIGIYGIPSSRPGPNAVRCVYMTNNSSLLGFTIMDGATAVSGDSRKLQSGGGIWCESTNAIISDCLIVSNGAQLFAGGVYGGSVFNSTFYYNAIYLSYGAPITSNGGGGAAFGILSNCDVYSNYVNYQSGGGVYSNTVLNSVIWANTATAGGGAQFSALINCVLSNNSGFTGGGACYCTLYNCLLTRNQGNYGTSADACQLYNCTSANNQPKQGYMVDCGACNCILYDPRPLDAYYDTFMTNCCTILVDPPFGHPLTNYDGGGNFTNAPLFVNTNLDFHLQSNSPCINAGRNIFSPPGTDLDGNPRIVGGTVDIGAYEYQNPTSVISYQWLQQYGLPTDGSADFADSDGDGMNNWQEWIAGTNPTNAASALEMYAAIPATNGVEVSWQSVANRSYYLQRALDLSVLPAFSLIQSNIAGVAGTNTFTDTTATNGGPYYYRIGVIPP